MDEQEARLILQAARPGDQDRNDPEIAAALQAVASNPDLGRWFAEEQAFDRVMAAHLKAVPPPYGLKTRILAHAAESAPARKRRWIVGLATAVALVVLLAAGVSLWRGPQAGASLPADYAREMTSFIRLGLTLEMESNDLGTIKNWVAKKEAAPMKVPAHLAALEPIGCRILSFRGHDVTLICFHREGSRVAHLFVVDRAAIPKMKPGDKPVFANEQGWMTATWAEGDRVYMIAMQGARAEIETYLPNA
jgi:hypothetical protein